MKQKAAPQLTPRQQEMLDFIQSSIREKRIPPSLAEMADHFQLECSTISRHLKAIQKKGFLDRSHNARSIVVHNNEPGCRTGHCSRIVRIRQEKRHKKSDCNVVLLTDDLLQLCPPERFSACRIYDRDIIGANVREGDIALIAPLEFRYPKSGDLVLAQLPGGQTALRNYCSRDNFFELSTENNSQPPLNYPHFCCADIILGTVIQLIRRF